MHHRAMDALFDEIIRAIDAHLYTLALMGSLALPDMCAALDSEDGKTSGARYIAWFDRNVLGMGRFDGEDCWGFRCSLTHQGRFRPHRGDFSRVIFVEPMKGLSFHLNISKWDSEQVLTIDVDRFCMHLVGAARSWADENAGTERFERNLAQFPRRHPHGLAPYIVGLPVIG